MKSSIQLAILVGAVAVGCGGPPKVKLSDSWPQKPGKFEDVSETWTRTGSLVASFRDGMSKLLNVSATFHAPEWRTAYVAFRAKREMLPPDRRAQLLAEQRANDEKYYEVTLLVATHSFRENDLQKGKRSVWRLALVDSKGNEREPIEVESVRTPREYLRAYFPRLGPQDEIYIARFAKEGLSLFEPGADKFSLKMASARGGVELIWKAK